MTSEKKIMWIVQHKGVIKHVHDFRPPDSISGLLKDKCLRKIQEIQEGHNGTNICAQLEIEWQR